MNTIVFKGLMNKFQIQKIDLLHASQNSIVYECLSNKYGKIIIKKYLDEKYFNKSNKFFNNFANLPMCHLYYVDNKNKIQVLEYIEGVTISKIKNYKKRLILGFNFLNNWASHVKTMQENELLYSGLVVEMLNECNTLNLFPEAENLLFNFKNHFKNFNSKYNKLYLIHGDLHYNNLIYTGNNLIAIDPSPKIASFAIEVAKFIENELYININLIEKKLDFIVKIFRFNIISEEELLEGLFIDSCRRTFDSYLKGDDEQTFIRGIKVNNKIFNYLEGRKSNGF